MNKDKLKSRISKKARGHSGLATQYYQMFFFEKYWKEFQEVNLKIILF